MSDSSERLFRDEAGAALERVAALEDENRRLRAEVERLANGTEVPERCPDPPVPNGRSAVAGMVTASLAVLFASSLSIFSGRHAHHDHVHPRLRDAMNPGVAVVLPPSTPTTTTTPAVIEVTPSSAHECVFVDADGFKHYKRECLERTDPWTAPGTGKR